MSGESSEGISMSKTTKTLVETLMYESHSNDMMSSSISANDDTPLQEKGFLDRVSKSIKRMFGCVNKPTRLDVDETVIDVNGKSAHSWITQQTASIHPYPVYDNPYPHFVIDLPPALTRVPLCAS